ncbi:hypothetical protein J5N97_012351 [Dioscorea zingiberensis]|uniref:BHLH domain-containing protein n=1 Tax=Dioscorea zingiberensis TaxID=325984 RepID=A0A9D5HI05_9LILI|nr:hypothetical protein J5N97_012351 [Dioscorea zingiberensis]
MSRGGEKAQETIGLSNSENSGKRVMESSNNSPVDEKHGGKGSSSSRKTESDHEMHIWTERERRKKMRNMFSTLHALLPNLPAKADKSSIVDEAVNYINSLQQTLHNLQKQKLERIRGMAFDQENQTQGAEMREAFLADQGKNWPAPMSSPTSVSIPRFPLSLQTWCSPNVVLSITGEDAHINICAARKPGLFSTICYIMEKHKLELVSAQISSDHFRSMFLIHARASGVSDQFPEALMIEEIFKLAVGEMLLCLSS